ncbi:MAG TPA: DegQ family serine endoprotease [Verrucomicrobiae bacterium]
MKTPIAKHANQWVGGILLGALLSLWLPVESPAAALPKLNIQSAPVNPALHERTSFAPMIKRVSPSVVNIYTAKTVRQTPMMSPLFDDPFFRQFFGSPLENMPRERREQALGSGVIISEDGYLLTNNHVVENADEIKVALADDKTVYDAKVIGTDPQTDIAVIKIEGKKLPAIVIGDSDTLEVGDTVLAIGNPFGVGQTVTTGIVSAKGRAGMGIVDYEDFIQTDAPINPGNSGGALVDVEGRLVGINTAIFSRSGGNNGIGFAVPINLARFVMERLVTDGKVTRGFLGVVIQPVTPDLAKAFDLKDATGALVGQVNEGSPADKAGLKEGDVVVRYNGKQVNDSRHLRLMVAQTPPDTEVKLEVIRDGKTRNVTVKLGELPKEGLARAGSGLQRGSSGDVLDGVTVDDLDVRTRRQFNIPNSVDGALVSNVDQDSPAAAAGLRPGDVIVEINRRPVANADEAIRLSRRVDGDTVLLRVWSQGGSRYVVVKARSK